ncbi:hypothetical protein N7453_007205 [Penicillium expansum]|nr:hypothetical protein N7453_007205 [Penicillium expansum]
MTTDPIYRRTPVLFLKYPKVHVVIMKAFTFMSFGLALSAALGALANPVSPRSPTSNDLDFRNEENRRIKYKGCTDAIEDKQCYFDSSSRECICQNV